MNSKKSAPPRPFAFLYLITLNCIMDIVNFFQTHWILLYSCRVINNHSQFNLHFLYYFCFGAANLVRLKFQILTLLRQYLKPVVIFVLSRIAWSLTQSFEYSQRCGQCLFTVFGPPSSPSSLLLCRIFFFTFQLSLSPKPSPLDCQPVRLWTADLSFISSPWYQQGPDFSLKPSRAGT